MFGTFRKNGFVVLPHDPLLAAWVRAARPAARQALEDPSLAHWYQCEKTWFVGVDALQNDVDGRLGAGPPLTDALWARFWRDHTGDVPHLHAGQLSVVWAGYPKPRAGETEAAFRYRVNRHAAHVDGLLAEGPDRRRFVREPHAFILGLPLTLSAPEAAPLIVWEGSHHIMTRAFREAYAGEDPTHWADLDITDVYTRARKDVFEQCEKRSVTAEPGQAILLHRHTLHGIGNWGPEIPPQDEGRQIVYYRPECPGGVRQWVLDD